MTCARKHNYVVIRWENTVRRWHMVTVDENFSIFSLIRIC